MKKDGLGNIDSKRIEGRYFYKFIFDDFAGKLLHERWYFGAAQCLVCHECFRLLFSLALAVTTTQFQGRCY